MTTKKILTQLKQMGTAQNRKVWRKHGAPQNALGVSFANINNLKKQILKTYKHDIKAQHTLAMQLFESGISDAQILGAMIADPLKLTKTKAKAMMKNISFYLVSNYLGGLFAQTSFVIDFMDEEMASSKEYIKHNGYDILATILKNGTPALTKARCRKYLKNIEKEIHASPNRAKNAMNNALIALGVYREDLREEVFTTAKCIGKVSVDHGETNCKTQDAVSYIQKSINYQKSKNKK